MLRVPHPDLLAEAKVPETRAESPLEPAVGQPQPDSVPQRVLIEVMALPEATLDPSAVWLGLMALALMLKFGEPAAVEPVRDAQQPEQLRALKLSPRHLTVALDSSQSNSSSLSSRVVVLVQKGNRRG